MTSKEASPGSEVSDELEGEFVATLSHKSQQKISRVEKSEPRVAALGKHRAAETLSAAGHEPHCSFGQHPWISGESGWASTLKSYCVLVMAL